MVGVKRGEGKSNVNLGALGSLLLSCLIGGPFGCIDTSCWLQELHVLVRKILFVINKVSFFP